MFKHFDELFLGILVGFIAGAVISSSVYVSYKEDASATKKKAIEVGAAYYHPTTGEFTWREPVSEPEKAKK